MNLFSRGLMAVFAAVFTVLAIAGGWFYHAQGRELRQEAEATLLAIAQLKADLIAEWRVRQLDDAADLAQSLLQTDAVPRYLANPQSETCQQVRARLHLLQERRHYGNILLVDTQGQVRLSLLPDHSNLHDQTLQALSQALTQRRGVIADFHVGPDDIPAHLDVIAPLVGGTADSPAPVGAVILRCDAEKTLYPLITSWPVPSRTAESLLVRRDGDSVLFLNALRHRPDAALRLRIPLDRQDVPAVMAAQGREGVADGIDYRGVPVLAALKAVPDSPWYLVAKVDAVEALAAWRTRCILVAALVAALLALIAAATAVLWQRNGKRHYRALFQAEAARRQGEERYRTTLLSIGDGVITTDAEGRVEILNAAAESMTGWSQEEARGRPIEEVFHIINEETRLPVENPVAHVLRDGTVVGLANHTVLVARGGTEYPIADSGAPVKGPDGRTSGVVLVFQDQTQERKHQNELIRLNRALRTITDCNQVLVRIQDEPTLLQDVCRILAEVGGYPFASVSMARQDEASSVQCVAQAGTERGYLEEAHVTWADTEYGQGPTGTAIRTGKMSVVQDIDTDPRYAPWRKIALARGFRSSAAFPLVSGDTTIGALTVCSAQAHSFTQDEMDLLQELADDMAYGITSLRTAELQRKTQQALREASQLTQEIVNSAQDGIIVYGPDLRYQLWNPFMASLTGVPAKDVLGTHPLERFPFLRDVGVLGRLEQALAGETTDPIDFQFQVPSTGHSGWVSHRSAPLRDTAGRIIGVIAIVQEISARKQSEAALAASENRYRSLVENIRLGITLVDKDFKVVMANSAAARLHRKQPDELVGQTCYRVFENRDHVCPHCPGISAMDKKMTVETESEVVRDDGTCISVRLQAFPVVQADGTVSGFIEIAEEITERKQLEQQLLQAQKMDAIGRLAGGIAHDFRNQLTIIRGFCEMLLRRDLVAPEGTDKLAQVLKAVDRSSLLTSQLLAFSRKDTLRPQVIDLDAQIADICKTLPQLIGEDIRLEVQPAKDTRYVRLDPVQFQQALLNIATNARDAMPKGGSLIIGTSRAQLTPDALRSNPDARPGAYVCVTVRDTGCGMDETVRPRIFEPFFTTKKVGEGTGLGLSMVHGFVTQSGGIVTVQSAPGCGSTFNLYFPECTAGQPDPEAKTCSPHATDRRTEVILVVEDEADVRALLAESLDESGYTVLQAASVEEALATIEQRSGRIDLLISDVVMPGASGVDLAQRLRATRPHIPILFMSGYPDRDLAGRGIVVDSEHILTKPISHATLVKAVRHFLDASSQQPTAADSA